MLKKFASCIREYRTASLLAPFFVILEVVMETVIPLLMAALIDQGIDPGDMSNIVKYGLILIIATIIALIFGACSGKYAALASAGFAHNLRKDMYYHIQDFSFGNIDKFSTAGIITRLTTDVTNMQNAYQMLIRIAVRCPVMLIFAFLMTCTINPTLALIFVCVGPILGICLALIMKNAYPIMRSVFNLYDRLNSVVQENILGIRVVKSFVREEHEEEKFQEVSKKIYEGFSKGEKLIAFTMPLMQISIYTCIMLISWFGAQFIVGGSMTTGQFSSLLTYSMQILSSLMMLAMVSVMLITARASAMRIAELMEERSSITNHQSPRMHIPDGSVSFEHVDFSYAGDPDKLALRDIDFTIPSGATVGIIGGTGSAKTSLVQLIPRLYEATRGTVKVGGYDVNDYDLETLRDGVAMVLQKNVLFSGTIKENLRWGNPDATDEEMIHACKLAQADDFIRTFPSGYDTYIEQGGTNVSGGQRQRLCIARALLKKPKILILDDSTSAVDTKTDSLIRRAFQEEIPGTTKFIVAQRISSIEGADYIIVLDNGKIDAIGTHEQLLAHNSIYQEVYESQTKGEEQA